MPTFALVALTAIVGVIQAQTAPNGYTLIADNDFVDAGPLTAIYQNVTTLQACADACSQDALCQSIMFSTFCMLYQLRRCMTPQVHNNVAPIPDRGQVYEKNSPVAIPSGSRINTVCGNYSGIVIASYTNSTPATFGPTLDANVAVWVAGCTQNCSLNANCHSWRVFEVYENNPNVPVVLRCTLYADSIYDVPNHGTFSVLNGLCKRASSIYGIKDAAVSQLNCTATSANSSSPGIGAGANPATSSPSVGAQNTATDPPVIISAPSKNPTTTSTSISSNEPAISAPMSSSRMTSTTPAKTNNSSVTFSVQLGIVFALFSALFVIAF